MVVQTGMGLVSHVSFSSDGRRLLTAGTAELGDTPDLRIWDVSAAAELLRLTDDEWQLPTWIVEDAFFSGGGKYAVTRTNQSLRLWNPQTGDVVREFIARERDTIALDILREGDVAFDGELVAAVGTFGGTASTRLWRASDGMVVRDLEPVYGLRFLPDGRLLTWSKNEIVVRDPRSGGSESRIETPYDIRNLALSSDGRVVAVASDEDFWTGIGATHRRIWVYELATRRLVRELTSDDVIGPLALSADGSRLVAGSFEAMRVWNTTGDDPPIVVPGHIDRVAAVAISPDGLVVAGGAFGGVELTDLRTRQTKALHGFTAPQSASAVSPRGDRILTGSSQGNAFVWSVADGARKRVAVHAREGEFGGQINSFAFSADGSRVLSAGNDGALRVWDPVTLEAKSTFKARLDLPMIKGAFSHNGRFVCGWSRYVSCWSSSGSLVREMGKSDEFIVDFALSPVTDDIVTITRSELQVRRIASGEIQRVVDFDCPSLCTVAFSPAGNIVTFGWAVEEFNGQTLERKIVVAELGGLAAYGWTDQAEERPVTPAFSRDGTRVAVVAGSALKSGGRQVRIFDTTASPWKIAGQFNQPTVVSSVAFSPDGRWLVTGSADGGTRIWDLTDPAAIATRAVLASMGTSDRDGWAIVAADGRFDAFDVNDTAGLHGVSAGLEVVALSKLKDRHQPNLLSRILGFRAK